ncbi:ski2-like helicase [Actinomyces bovis]|uniref:Ski2-like helicase n=1 Tax=Actinomyces bovis TaxID=1658 RepID=A0ABY1VPG1_9ACTO|nr:DEAD/DEAH box helicase [Actinomyces bovis]SPT54014.1 ski2-like helicase [Actinomyces bovis]VEG53854.1 ski2-like helicase [Actinomyces israelii]
MSSPAERYAAARRRQEAARTELARFRETLSFQLDEFQELGCQALERGEGVLVAAPTGAGKTVVGEFAVHLALAKALKAFYTTPIKALSNQKYLDLCERFGSDQVGLLTGDTSVNPHAQVVVMTTEVLRNMLYSGSSDLSRLGFVVMDEVHYLADRFRGPVWEEVIIHLAPQVQVVSLSATVSNAEEFGDWLDQVRGSTTVVVSEHRPVPLTQHMLVGRRLLPLYSVPVAVEDAAAEAALTSQPPLNPELLNAVRSARRAAAGGNAVSKREQRSGGQGFRQPWKRGETRGLRAPRRGVDGARVARLRPPARPAVIQALGEARLLPAIVFVFSRAGCEQAVNQAMAGGVDLTTDTEAKRIREVIERRVADIPGADLAVLGFHAWARALERGVAAHHAGLLPVFKETVEELFSAGLVKVVYATETLALGINMPARTVVLESLRKWNGSAHVNLTPGEYTQLTGRAGRRGIDVEGHAVVLAVDDLEPSTVSSLASRRTYPLVSAFRPTYNMAVNLLGRTNRARAREVLESSFAQFQADRGVVELAAAARRKRRSVEGLEAQMTCHLGDFREYARLRQQIAEAESTLKQETSAARRLDAGRSMSALNRGAVVIYRKGRRVKHAVVLEVGQDRLGTPALTVLGEDGRITMLTPETAPDGVTRVGELRVPDSAELRRPRDRDRLVGRLITAIRTGQLQEEGRRRHRGGKEERSRHCAVEQLEELRHQLRAHPCHACADRVQHARIGRKWAKALAEAERLQNRVVTRTGTISRLFDAVCEVLLTLGYLEPVDRGHPERELRVTAAGRMLARVYAERDLLIAECLRTGTWADLSSGDLAGAVSACVYEPRLTSNTLGLPVSPGSRLGAVLRAELGVSRRINELEALARIEHSTGAEAALAGPVKAWAEGAELGEVLEACELTAGDFVRWCKQLLDVLTQIAAFPMDAPGVKLEPAGVASKGTPLNLVAAQAAQDVARGVVSWSSL